MKLISISAFVGLAVVMIALLKTTTRSEFSTLGPHSSPQLESSEEDPVEPMPVSSRADRSSYATSKTVGNPVGVHENTSEATGARTVSVSEVQPGTSTTRISETLGDGAEAVETFFPSGSPWEIYQLVDGKLDGIVKTFRPGGGIVQTQAYSMGLKDGAFEMYDVQGNLVSSGVFSQDEKEGPWLRWDSSGKLREDITYVSGKRHGPCLYYDGAGNLINEKSGRFESDTRMHGL